MTNETKLIVIIIIYIGMILFLRYYAMLPNIRRQSRKYLQPNTQRSCGEHSKSLVKGELAVVDNKNCDKCKNT